MSKLIGGYGDNPTWVSRAKTVKSTKNDKPAVKSKKVKKVAERLVLDPDPGTGLSVKRNAVSLTEAVNVDRDPFNVEILARKLPAKKGSERPSEVTSEGVLPAQVQRPVVEAAVEAVAEAPKAKVVSGAKKANYIYQSSYLLNSRVLNAIVSFIVELFNGFKVKHVNAIAEREAYFKAVEGKMKYGNSNNIEKRAAALKKFENARKEYVEKLCSLFDSLDECADMKKLKEMHNNLFKIINDELLESKRTVAKKKIYAKDNEIETFVDVLKRKDGTWLRVNHGSSYSMAMFLDILRDVYAKLDANQKIRFEKAVEKVSVALENQDVEAARSSLQTLRSSSPSVEEDGKDVLNELNAKADEVEISLQKEKIDKLDSSIKATKKDMSDLDSKLALARNKLAKLKKKKNELLEELSNAALGRGLNITLFNLYVNPNMANQLTKRAKELIKQVKSEPKNIKLFKDYENNRDQIIQCEKLIARLEREIEAKLDRLGDLDDEISDVKPIKSTPALPLSYESDDEEDDEPLVINRPSAQKKKQAPAEKKYVHKKPLPDIPKKKLDSVSQVSQDASERSIKRTGNAIDESTRRLNKVFEDILEKK